MEFSDARILVFAKSPSPGQVKTRLIPELGEAGATRLYHQLLSGTLEMVSREPLARVQCWATPPLDHPLLEALAARHNHELHAQQGSDLGERMGYAIQQQLKQASRLLLIGTDCPALTPEHLRCALEWLDDGADAVLGPAEDGGYVLLGVSGYAAALFQSMPWGSERVLDLTRARLSELGWQWRELPVLWDVDRPEDLQRYHKLCLPTADTVFG